MAIKYNGRDLQKRIINGREVEKVMYNGVQIRPSSTPPVSDDYLCFTSLEGDNTLSLNLNGAGSNINLEISWDKTNWIDYTIGNTIHFANANDKLYWRNKSTTPTGFSVYTGTYIGNYNFSTGKTFAVSGDVNFLLCKTSTTTLTGPGCFYSLFYNTKITTPPRLPATTLTNFCYAFMFRNCYSLNTLPSLPATTLMPQCYAEMFSLCSVIKLSTTQTGEYQTAYMIPINGGGTAGENSLFGMFAGTGGTFTGTPSINTTYYTSNTVV